MRSFMLLVAMGYAVLASAACRTHPTTPLTAAAARDDADGIRRLLGAGHTADEGGDTWTGLIWAARENGIAAMTVLLDAGADVNQRDRANRWTPLLHAIHRQNAAAAELLLDRGADPNMSSPEGVTPLMMAADNPRPAIVQALLKHGANARTEGPGGITALTQAVSGGALTDVTDRPLLGGCHPDTVRAIVDHDRTLQIPKNFAGRHAIWWARFHGCEDVLRMVGFEQVGAAHEAITGVGLMHDAMRQTFKSRAPKPPDGR